MLSLNNTGTKKGSIMK